ncbi:flavin reductase family protein [Marinicella sp. W31]|uniref:flavin reductase family protein n=1 Tax=Marinicella sp. W31 TaxID=3023713 RepID=UPI003758300A
MPNKIFTRDDLDNMERIARLKFINCLSGFKSGNLIGTADPTGHTNLSIVSSVFHLGANPPLMGMVMRPHTTPRHTWENIQETGFYTINHVHKDITSAAHQTSARYPRETSEFDAVGLTPEYTTTLKAPYVAESQIKIGLSFQHHLPVELNNTLIIIGEIVEVIVPHQTILEDGFLDIEAANTVAVSGLDRYHYTTGIHRLSYAKSDHWPEEL